MMSDFSRQPKVIGFAGHRNVPDRLALGEVIRRELGKMKDALGGRVIAISSAAAGAMWLPPRLCGSSNSYGRRTSVSGGEVLGGFRRPA